MKNLLILFVFSIISTGLFSQDIPIPKKEKLEEQATQFILKIAPFPIVGGDCILEVEKKLSETISLQIGSGITFHPIDNGYSKITSEKIDFLINPERAKRYSGLPEFWNDYKIRKGNLGFRLSASGRYYFSREVYDKFYFSPSITYSRYNQGVQKIVDTSIPTVFNPNEFIEEKINNIDITGRFGYQFLTKKVSFDSFLARLYYFFN